MDLVTVVEDVRWLYLESREKSEYSENMSQVIQFHRMYMFYIFGLKTLAYLYMLRSAFRENRFRSSKVADEKVLLESKLLDNFIIFFSE